MGKPIEYGVRKPEGSDFDRRPNQGDNPKDAYKFDTQKSASKISGNGEKQKKSQGGMVGHGKGGNDFGKPKGSVGSFGGFSSGKQTKGFGGQLKGKNK
jgi:hypothetical protein